MLSDIRKKPIHISRWLKPSRAFRADKNLPAEDLPSFEKIPQLKTPTDWGIKFDLPVWMKDHPGENIFTAIKESGVKSSLYMRTQIHKIMLNKTTTRVGGFDVGVDSNFVITRTPATTKIERYKVRVYYKEVKSEADIESSWVLLSHNGLDYYSTINGSPAKLILNDFIPDKEKYTQTVTDKIFGDITINRRYGHEGYQCHVNPYGNNALTFIYAFRYCVGYRFLGNKESKELGFNGKYFEKLKTVKVRIK
jgi:hypothetical protein